jgi:hypothetical protein
MAALKSFTNMNNIGEHITIRNLFVKKNHGDILNILMNFYYIFYKLTTGFNYLANRGERFGIPPFMFTIVNLYSIPFIGAHRGVRSAMGPATRHRPLIKPMTA